jgi:hypothetical protein
VQQTLAPAEGLESGVRSLLAITERCCKEDLGVDPELSLEAVAKRHQIARKFVELRTASPIGQETIRSLRGTAPVFSLHAGEERGATVADAEYQVVWLLATGIHREGDRRDAYAHFKRLFDRDVLFPTEADYESLFERRNAATLPVLLSRVSATYARAREYPLQPQTVLLPGAVTLTVLVAPMPGDGLAEVEQIWMALNPRSLPKKLLPLIQAALTPGASQQPWQWVQDFPDRPPDRTELRFTCWYEVKE